MADMSEYKCTRCSYIYVPKYGDPGRDIATGTPFADIPEDWVCPVCGAAKALFSRS